MRCIKVSLSLKINIFLFFVMHVVYNLPYDIDYQYALLKVKRLSIVIPIVKLLFYFLQFWLNLLLIWLNFVFSSLKSWIEIYLEKLQFAFSRVFLSSESESIIPAASKTELLVSLFRLKIVSSSLLEVHLRYVQSRCTVSAL